MRALACALAAALVLGACGGSEETRPAAARPGGIVDSSKEPPYVNGLDVNPRDGSLLIATNLGLYRVGADGRRARRLDGRVEAAPSPVPVGRQGLAFSFVGPDRLLGSGHPDRAGALPESLGLLRSEDGGRTWKPLSRMGESDLHSIHLVEGSVVAADVTTFTVLVSPDGGRTWEQRVPPEPLFDLAVDQRDPGALVASSQRRLFTSRDGGRTWRPREDAPFALLEWGEGDRVLRVDEDGTVRESRDGGTAWMRVGAVRRKPQALARGEDGDLYVAGTDGTVERSRDGGRTWAVHFRPA
jgi:photosystem II stability/assembly factor-like uncharacterized protein